MPCQSSCQGAVFFFFKKNIWPNLYQSDCSIFGIGLEAAERSLFFICSKYLSINVNGKTKGRDWYGLQSCTVSGSWWFPLPPSSVGNVDVERLEYDSGPALWKMFLPVTGSLQWNYYFCWVRNVAISLRPVCVWSGLYLTEPALGIWRLPWGQQVFAGLD